MVLVSVSADPAGTQPAKLGMSWRSHWLEAIYRKTTSISQQPLPPCIRVGGDELYLALASYVQYCAQVLGSKRNV